MGLDEKDFKMMCIMIPVVDYWEMKEEIDRLGESVVRLEQIVTAMVDLHREERVKNWEMILQEMLKQKGNRSGNRIG